ncbi:hypothetical protein [Brevibacillus laterosporus]|uniref:hypothetical protein n=1 Tax=Brevibacillus laterosporus TaxID=1465 RepID=UPI0018F88DDC|nr:hypothetical protein [Brevibacillus laterosporus]MBG9776166.1 hypothetical protein [Brevibacillus laterosporus]
MDFDRQFERDKKHCRSKFIDSLKGRKDVFVQEVRRIVESDRSAPAKLYEIGVLIKAFDSFESKGAEVIQLQPKGGK